MADSPEIRDQVQAMNARSRQLVAGDDRAGARSTAPVHVPCSRPSD